MRGRRPSGPEYVDHLQGSDLAKQRLKVVLETLAGTCRVQEACVRLGLSEPRFHQLRERMLTAAMARMEPRRPGRRAKKPTQADEQLRLLEQQLADQNVQLRVAQARTEIALILPNVGQSPPEKKTRQRSKQPLSKVSNQVPSSQALSSQALSSQAPPPP
jgi:hypothetical protein